MRTWVVLLALGCGSTACSSTTTLTANVDDSEGLAPGSTVTVAGVHVGQVTEVGVVDGRAQVTIAVDDGQDVALHQGACARVEGSSLVLDTGGTGEFGAAVVPPCPRSLSDQAHEHPGRRLHGVAGGAREVGRRLSKTAAEFSRGLAENPDDLRETGSNLTMAGRAFAEGVEEAANER
ncbi:MAG: MlaD family protein [Myxococcota bacterium]